MNVKVIGVECSRPGLQQGEPAYKLSVAWWACLSPLLQYADMLAAGLGHSFSLSVPIESHKKWTVLASWGPAALSRPLQSNYSLSALGVSGYSWSDSSLELELGCVSEATDLGMEGAEDSWAVGWLKGSCGPSYWGSSPSDGSSPSERYGGGGRSNQGGRLGEKQTNKQTKQRQEEDDVKAMSCYIMTVLVFFFIFFFKQDQQWAKISDKITWLYIDYILTIILGNLQTCIL